MGSATLVAQDSRRHHPVAAVIAFPAHDDHPLPSEVGDAIAQEFGHPGSRVFHELKRRHAELLVGAAVDLAHLCCG